MWLSLSFNEQMSGLCKKKTFSGCIFLFLRGFWNYRQLVNFQSEFEAEHYVSLFIH